MAYLLDEKVYFMILTFLAEVHFCQYNSETNRFFFLQQLSKGLMTDSYF